MILRQTGALFLDAFRELHARKMFWLTMILSGLFVLVFALFKVDDEGIHFAAWTLPDSEGFAEQVGARFFFLFFMNLFGINIWLARAATIIAMISTASIVPDFIADGRIDTMLSKPISRVRLFVTKYVTGLFFVALQVLVFSLGCFLVIGWRGGSWEWGLFLAVPLLVLFFSYLYAFMTLIALLTRSALTSVLLTCLLWGLIFGLNVADAELMEMKNQAAYEAEHAAVEADFIEARVNAARQSISETREQGEKPGRLAMNFIEQNAPRIPTLRTRSERAQEREQDIASWHGYVMLAKSPLPKTGETIGLLSRTLIDFDDLISAFPGLAERGGIEFQDFEAIEGVPEEINGVRNPDSVKSQAERSFEESQGRTIVWVIGTSLLFEAFVLGICCLIFVRRDF